MPCMLIFRLTECLALRGDRRGKRVSAPLVKLLFYFFWTTEPKPPSPPIKVESFGDPPIVGGNRPVPSALICIRYTFCSCCHMFFFPPSTINNNKSRQRGLTRCLHPPRKGSSGLLIEKRPEVESLEDTPVPSVVWFFFFYCTPRNVPPSPFRCFICCRSNFTHSMVSICFVVPVCFTSGVSASLPFFSLQRNKDDSSL